MRWAGTLIVLVIFLAFMPPVYAGEPAGTQAGAQEPVQPRKWGYESNQLKGIVVAVHGTSQHSGCFESLGQHLSSRGFVVVAKDLRGFGQWYHTDSDKGKIHKIDFNKSVEDLVSLCEKLHEEYPGLPVFCVGESAGAAVVIRTAGKRSDLVDGVILSSPGSKPCKYVMRRLIPDVFKSVFMLGRGLDVSRYITRFASHDPRVANEMISDPLTRITLGPLEILRTRRFMGKNHRYAKCLPSDVPVLILQGEEDRILKKSTAKSMFRLIKSEDKSMVCLPACGHVLVATSFVDPRVLRSLDNWLLSHARPESLMDDSDHPQPIFAAGDLE